MRRDYGKLLDAVEWEGRILSPAELEEIAYDLQLEDNQINPYQRLRLLGLGGNAKYRPLVERFLELSGIKRLNLQTEKRSN